MVVVLAQLLHIVFLQTLYENLEYPKCGVVLENNLQSFFKDSYNIEIHSSTKFIVIVSYLWNVFQNKTFVISDFKHDGTHIFNKNCLEIISSKIEYHIWRQSCTKYALLIMECVNISDIQDQIKSLKIEANMYLIATCVCGNSDTIYYYNVLQKRLGHWDDVKDSMNFMGEALEIQIIRTLTARIKGKYSPQQQISEVTLEGIDPMVANVLSSSLNFTLDLKGRVASRYGYRTADGNFTGKSIIYILKVYTYMQIELYRKFCHTLKKYKTHFLIIVAILFL